MEKNKKREKKKKIHQTKRNDSFYIVCTILYFEKKENFRGITVSPDVLTIAHKYVSFGACAQHLIGKLCTIYYTFVSLNGLVLPDTYTKYIIAIIIKIYHLVFFFV